MLYGNFRRPKFRSNTQDSRSVCVCNINVRFKENIEEKKLLLGFGEEIMCPRNTKDAHLDVRTNEIVLYNFTQKKTDIFTNIF